MWICAHLRFARFQTFLLALLIGNRRQNDVAPNVLNVNISFTVLKVPREIWIRMVLNYKYATYEKYLVDLTWELCAFLIGTAANPLGEIVMQNFLKLRKNVELNFKLQCPFNGTLNTLITPLNISDINMPLMPAGRYRFDLHYSSHKGGPAAAILHYFLSISDLRVWF